MKKIRYLKHDEVLDIYRENIQRFGGFGAVRDNNALLSCIVNPHRMFSGRDLYPSIEEKVAILVFSLIKNHPFVDGNKRTAFTVGRVFLRLNSYDFESNEEYYQVIKKVARSEMSQEDFFDWVKVSVKPL
jgi:death-on-curing protein